MRAEYGAELAAPHLALAEGVGEPLTQAFRELAGPLRVGQVGDAHVDLPLVGRLDRELLQAGQRLAGGAHLLQRGHLAVLDLQQRLHRQRAAEQRRGGADPAPAAEVLQRVHVEQRGAGRGPALGRRGRILHRAPLADRVRGRQRGVPRRHADLPAVHAHHPHRGVPGRELGRLEGAAHLPGDVHRHDLLGPRQRGPLVGVEQHRGCRARRAHREELTERGRHPLGRRVLGALVVRLGADHHLQRHHGDPARLRHLRREAGRRVRDHGDRRPGWHGAKITHAAPGRRTPLSRRSPRGSCPR